MPFERIASSRASAFAMPPVERDEEPAGAAAGKTAADAPEWGPAEVRPTVAEKLVTRPSEPRTTPTTMATASTDRKRATMPASEGEGRIAFPGTGTHRAPRPSGSESV